MHKIPVVKHNPNEMQIAICKKTLGFSGIRQSKNKERMQTFWRKRSILFFSKSNSGTSRGIKEGVVQPVLSYSKERGRLMQSLKQIPEEIQVQNADTQIYVAFCTERRLVHLNHSKRIHIFTSRSILSTNNAWGLHLNPQHTNSSFLPFGTPHFHKIFAAGIDTTEAAGHKNISISQQLVNLCQFKSDGRAAYKGSIYFPQV